MPPERRAGKSGDGVSIDVGESHAFTHAVRRQIAIPAGVGGDGIRSCVTATRRPSRPPYGDTAGRRDGPTGFQNPAVQPATAQ
jgi:hypothetical protein